MAHGTRDYWPTTNLSIFSEAYTDKISAWVEFGLEVLGIAEDVIIIDYTVPADTVLVIGCGFFGCSRPGINRLIIKRDAETLADFDFDVYDPLPPVPWGLWRFKAAEQLTVQVYNFTLLGAVRFTATLTGFTELLT